MCRVPRPAPTCHSANAAAFASLSIAARDAETVADPLRGAGRLRAGCSRTRRRPRALVDSDGTPRPIAADAVARTAPRRRCRAPRGLLLGRRSASANSGRGRSRRRGRRRPRAIFVPPRSTPMTRIAPGTAATITRRDGPWGKAVSRLSRRPGQGEGPAAEPVEDAAPQRTRRRAGRRARADAADARRWGRRIVLVVLVLLLVIVVWAVRELRRVRQRRRRRERPAPAPRRR